MNFCLFSFILCLSPVLQLLLVGLHQHRPSMLNWCTPKKFRASCSSFAPTSGWLHFFFFFFSPGWLILQMEMLSEFLLWSSKFPRKVQVSLGERSADLQRQEGSSDGISSEHTLLANLFQGIRKEKKKRKGKKRPKKKKKDNRFWLSCLHLIAPVQRCIFLFCVFVSLGAFSNDKPF